LNGRRGSKKKSAKLAQIVTAKEAKGEERAPNSSIGNKREAKRDLLKISSKGIAERDSNNEAEKEN